MTEHPSMKPNGLGKQLAISYCSYVGMYIFAQDANSQYLGLITDNIYNTESIINDYGTYGSQYSTTSIRNQYSTYGSATNTYSAYNQYSSTPPIIYSYNSSTSKYTAVAYLTKNTLKTPAIDPDLLIAILKVGCSSLPPTNITDLLVDSLTCTIIGDSIRVRFITLNSGNLDISKAFKIGLYNNGVLLNYWNSTTTLHAGYYYTMVYSFKPTVQTNVIKAWVDYDNLITEDYENNNTLSTTVNANLSILTRSDLSANAQSLSHISIFGGNIFVDQLDNPMTLCLVDITGKSIASYKIDKMSRFILPLNNLLKVNGTYICFLRSNGNLIGSKIITLTK